MKKVKEVMTPDVAFINSDNTISEAARKMLELDVGLLPVVIGTEIVGVITDRDIVLRSVAQGYDPEKTPTLEAVTESIANCNEDDDIETAARIMKDKQIRRVLVKNDDMEFSGVVSLGDLAMEDLRESAEVLQKVSAPST